MSETTPGETPVERRLREMADAERKDAMQWSEIDCPSADAADAGREALALLREWRRLWSGTEATHKFGTEMFRNDVDALLARCEGDR